MSGFEDKKHIHCRRVFILQNAGGIRNAYLTPTEPKPTAPWGLRPE